MSSAMASLSSVSHISTVRVQQQQQRRPSNARRAVQVQALFGRKQAAVIEAPPPPPPKPQSRLSSLFGSRNAPDSSKSTNKKPQQQKSTPPPPPKPQSRLSGLFGSRNAPDSSEKPQQQQKSAKASKTVSVAAKPSSSGKAVASKSSGKSSSSSDSGVDKAAEYKRRQGMFGGLMGALDFSEVRSTSDAELLYDAKYGKLENGKLSPEQARALRRRVGGTAKDYWCVGCFCCCCCAAPRHVACRGVVWGLPRPRQSYLTTHCAPPPSPPPPPPPQEGLGGGQGLVHRQGLRGAQRRRGCLQCPRPSLPAGRRLWPLCHHRRVVCEVAYVVTLIS